MMAYVSRRIADATPGRYSPLAAYRRADGLDRSALPARSVGDFSAGDLDSAQT
jgi:hypothetical protein